MAGFVMEFDMTSEIQTPRGSTRPDVKKRAAAAEAAKKELASKVRVSLLKLKDRDTQQQAMVEMQKVCDELRPEHVQVLHNTLFSFDGEKSSFARAQSARFFADIAKTHFDARSLNKVVSRLCDRARDSDAKVREACAETIGELARLFCSSPEYLQQQQPQSENQDPEVSVTSDSSPSLNLFFNPVFKHMETGDTNGQIGNALALAHVVFNSASHILPYLEKLTHRILAILDRSTFLGRSDLLIAIANIIEVCPEGVTPFIDPYFARIAIASQDKDFNVRKAAMETVETLASRIEPDVLQEFKVCARPCAVPNLTPMPMHHQILSAWPYDRVSCLRQVDINKMLEKCRYDSKPPVREAALAAIQAMSKTEMAYDAKHRDGGDSQTSSKHADPHASAAEDVENEDASVIAQSENAPAAAIERVPMPK